MLRLDFGKAIQEKERAFAHIPRTAPTLTELLWQIIMKLSDFKHAIARFFGKCKREDTISKALVGSSASSNFGCILIAMAMATRCFMPPDS